MSASNTGQTVSFTPYHVWYPTSGGDFKMVVGELDSEVGQALWHIHHAAQEDPESPGALFSFAYSDRLVIAQTTQRRANGRPSVELRAVAVNLEDFKRLTPEVVLAGIFELLSEEPSADKLYFKVPASPKKVSLWPTIAQAIASGTRELQHDLSSEADRQTIFHTALATSGNGQGWRVSGDDGRHLSVAVGVTTSFPWEMRKRFGYIVYANPQPAEAAPAAKSPYGATRLDEVLAAVERTAQGSSLDVKKLYDDLSGLSAQWHSIERAHRNGLAIGKEQRQKFRESIETAKYQFERMCSARDPKIPDVKGLAESFDVWGQSALGALDRRPTVRVRIRPHMSKQAWLGVGTVAAVAVVGYAIYALWPSGSSPSKKSESTVSTNPPAERPAGNERPGPSQPSSLDALDGPVKRALNLAKLSLKKPQAKTATVVFATDAMDMYLRGRARSAGIEEGHMDSLKDVYQALKDGGELEDPNGLVPNWIRQRFAAANSPDDVFIGKDLKAMVDGIERLVTTGNLSQPAASGATSP